MALEMQEGLVVTEACLFNMVSRAHLLGNLAFMLHEVHQDPGLLQIRGSAVWDIMELLKRKEMPLDNFPVMKGTIRDSSED